MQGGRSAYRSLLGVAGLILALSGAREGYAQATNDTLRLDSLSGRGLDANGFLLNPRWSGLPDDGVPDVERRCRFRVATGALEERELLVTRGPCLTTRERDVVTLNEAPSTLGLGLVCNTNSEIGSVRGHVNWFPVTVTGQLYWDEYSGKDPSDNDVNFNLAAPEPGALTTGNPSVPGSDVNARAYHLEFSYLETLARLGGLSYEGPTWWVALRDSLANRSAMRRLVDGRIARVTGIYGLDGVHAFQAEIHPVFSMAVLLDTARSPNRGVRERWALMVRDRGNEGDCGHGKLPLTLSADSVQTLLVDLGTAGGTRRPAVSLDRVWSTDASHQPVVRLDTASGHVLVGFPHARPAADRPDFAFIGTLLVEWGAGDPWAWRDRFSGWLSAGRPEIKLDSLASPAESTITFQVLSRLDDELTERGRPFPSPLDALAPASLPESLGVFRAQTLRADRVLPWLEAGPVLQGCQEHPSDFLCRSTVETGLAYSFASGGSAGWFLTPIYLSAHTVHPFCHGECVWDRALDAFALRLDLSWERFSKACEALPCTAASYPGWSARASFVFAPVGFRVGPALVSVYNVLSAGFSRLIGVRGGSLITGVGPGLRVKPLRYVPGAFFVEGQHTNRSGGYERRWSLNTGLYFHWYRFPPFF